MAKVILDAGHGGSDTGEVYYNRNEKDDTLKLALRVGDLLTNEGIEVAYTRTTDTYLSQLDRVSLVNNIEGDLLVSLHRLFGRSFTSTPTSEYFVYEEGGLAYDVATEIVKNLSDVGYGNSGIIIRTDIPLLNNTNMPAFMVGTGYMKSEEENEFYDKNFEAIASAIADGIKETLLKGDNMKEKSMVVTENPSSKYHYHVQIGLFRNYNNALSLQLRLFREGYPVDIAQQGECFAVHVGVFDTLDEAVVLERILRLIGYNTLLVAV